MHLFQPHPRQQFLTFCNGLPKMIYFSVFYFLYKCESPASIVQCWREKQFWTNVPYFYLLAGMIINKIFKIKVSIINEFWPPQQPETDFYLQNISSNIIDIFVCFRALVKCQNNETEPLQRSFSTRWQIYEGIFSREGNSTITNVCLSSKPPLSFTLQPSFRNF